MPQVTNNSELSEILAAEGSFPLPPGERKSQFPPDVGIRHVICG